MTDATRQDSPLGAPVIVVCGLAFEAQIAAGPGMVTVCGPGPRRVAQALDALLGADPAPARAYAGILSFGCAGGLDPALRPGDCVIGAGVRAASDLLPADAAWVQALAARLPDATQGWLAGLDAPLVARDDKANAWHAGARGVDMESHAAASAARRYGLPFAALRVVLDPAWRSLPPSALAAMREDGGTDLAALLRSLAGRPGDIVPLMALAIDAWRARRGLRRVRAALGAQPGP